MKALRLIAVLMMTGSAIATGQISAADQQKDRVRDQTQEQVRQRDRIYGYELMTPQERNEYRQRMRAAQTEQEREKIRAEHHEQMQARAKERGVTLPAVPPAGRGPRGPGAGGGKS